MPATHITQFTEPDKQLREYFQTRHSQQVPEKLQKLFDIAMNDKRLFPDMNLSAKATHQDYIDRWAQGYIEADNNPARTRKAKPKSSCNDPAIKTIVKMVTGITEEEATNHEAHHNLFMSAENIQGALLEEYIDSVISYHGWIWCKGNTLRSIDFCTSDGTRLLQIKNKSNSENSSSSSIRSGTTIEKWYRLGTGTETGKKIPVYKWDDLNEIIESASRHPCNLSEEAYVKYVEEVAINNPWLITDL